VSTAQTTLLPALDSFEDNIAQPSKMSPCPFSKTANAE
jgi:hypothetical protein